MTMRPPRSARHSRSPPFGLAASRSPSPWPSPAGRGNTASRAATSRGAQDWRKRGGRFSLSPRERAGVRGKPRSKHKCACELPMNSTTQEPCAPRFNAEAPAPPSAFDSPRSGERFSLSPRERAGLRGKILAPVARIHAQAFEATPHPVPLSKGRWNPPPKCGVSCELISMSKLQTVLP